MKTLDEVIKACEETVSDVDRGVDIEGCYLGATETRDALHYLKEFKRISARLEKIALGNITETLEKLDNPALSWDELRQMESKPVWVHLFGSGLGEWNLIHAQLDNQIWFTDGNGYIYDMHEEKQGRTWQAYRKERHEDAG